MKGVVVIVPEEKRGRKKRTSIIRKVK